jgi:hypothetical protein
VKPGPSGKQEIRGVPIRDFEFQPDSATWLSRQNVPET